MSGANMKVISQVVDITGKNALAGIKEVLPGLTKKDRLSLQELLSMAGV
jgi:hypothetical protein